MNTHTHWRSHICTHGPLPVAAACFVMAFLLIAELPNDRSDNLPQSIVTPKHADARRAVPKGTKIVGRRLVTKEETLHAAASNEKARIAPETNLGAVIDNVRHTSAARIDTNDDFPAFEYTVMPVSRTPNWGAMQTAQEWSRAHAQMTDEDFVSVPAYDLSVLTTPLSKLLNPRNIDAITAKLFYSTRYFGTYDLDASEFSGSHQGIDLKLADGAPVSAIAGGKVRSVLTSDALGLHVIIEHRLPNEETVYSVYGHLRSANIQPGQAVRPGTVIGTIGMTGNTSAPHLHLQIDRGNANEEHVPYAPRSKNVSRAEAARRALHPITFIEEYSKKD